MHNFADWTIKDRFPEKDLDSIEPISLRAFSLISRNKTYLDEKQGAIELLGALNIMEGLDYHHKNFLQFKQSENSSNRFHEIVAYLNRVGQFYYFVKSEFTQKHIEGPSKLVPTLEELIVFRNKNTAHRSIDYPYGESTHYRNRQALSFIGFRANYYMEYEKFILPTEEGDKTKWNYFIPEIHHPKLMMELYTLIDNIVKTLILH